jgi:hypothetical protein
MNLHLLFVSGGHELNHVAGHHARADLITVLCYLSLPCHFFQNLTNRRQDSGPNFPRPKNGSPRWAHPPIHSDSYCSRGFWYPRPDPYRQIQIVSDIEMSLPAGDTLTKLILDRSRTSQTLKYMGKQNFPVKK